MTVTDAFSQWYQQLHDKDKRVLCNFLRQWLSQTIPPRMPRGPSFEGIRAGPAPENPARHVKCPNCGIVINI